MKILVCDDRESNCDALVKTIREAISEEATIEGLSSTKLAKTLLVLFESIESFLDDECRASVEKTLFDDYDLIVIDNNLTHLKVPGGRITAESIAGYIRAFTTATYIISVNKNPDVNFDLRFLIGDYNTRTDLALNEIHLDNCALWTGDPRDVNGEFIPWYWPRLNGIVKRRQEQIAFVHEHLDDAVLSSLGFDEETIGVLSYHAKGALFSSGARSGVAGAIDEVIFRDVFLEVDSLPIWAERNSLHKARASRFVQNVIARVVAAYIDRWFRRDVLGPQEALVELPHLLMRLPFLLGEKAGDSAKWNNAILEDNPPYGMDPTLYEAHLAATEFKHKMWSKGPCFWWPSLKSNDALSEHFQTVEDNLLG